MRRIILLSLIVFFASHSLVFSEAKIVTEFIEEQVNAVDALDENALSIFDVNIFLFRAYGDHEYRNRNYEKAAKYYLLFLKNRVDSPKVIYRLSRCYAHLDKPKLAAKTLLAAYEYGFYDYDRIHSDTAFDKVKRNIHFKSTLKYIKQQNVRFGKKIYFKSPVITDGRIHLPDNFDPEKEYPLFIGLHGRGGNAENFATVWERIKVKDFIFVVPEAPYALGADSAKGKSRSWFYLTADRQIWNFADPFVVEYLANIQERMKREYKIKSTFILGFSQGVAAAYFAAFKKPYLFDGVIAFAGNLPEGSFLEESDFKKAEGLKFFLAHGDKDRAIKAATSKKIYNFLKKKGLNTQLHIFNGDHMVDQYSINKALDWMLKGVTR